MDTEDTVINTRCLPRGLGHGEGRWGLWLEKLEMPWILPLRIGCMETYKIFPDLFLCNCFAPGDTSHSISGHPSFLHPHLPLKYSPCRCESTRYIPPARRAVKTSPRRFPEMGPHLRPRLEPTLTHGPIGWWAHLAREWVRGTPDWGIQPLTEISPYGAQENQCGDRPQRSSM